MGFKTNRTSFLPRNRRGYYNTELKTGRHLIWQHWTTTVRSRQRRSLPVT